MAGGEGADEAVDRTVVDQASKTVRLAPSVIRDNGEVPGAGRTQAVLDEMVRSARITEPRDEDGRTVGNAPDRRPSIFCDLVNHAQALVRQLAEDGAF